MPNRRPLVQVSGVQTEIPITDNMVTGMESNLSRTVLTGAVTAITATTRYTVLSGTTGGSLAITLPAANAANDGLLFTFVSTSNRGSTSWISSGGTVTGLPASLSANTPVTVQYVHSATRWFVS